VHHAGADIGCFSTLWGGTLIRSDQPSAVRFFAQGIPVLYATRVITGATEKGTQQPHVGLLVLFTQGAGRPRRKHPMAAVPSVGRVAVELVDAAGDPIAVVAGSGESCVDTTSRLTSARAR
jgi:hypothetical protein